MAISEAFANTQSVSTTEWSLPRDASYDIAQPQTDDGVYQCFIDVNAVAFADEFQFRVYEKVQSSDTQRIVYEAIIAGPQSTPIFVTPSLVLIHGWDMTLDKLAGTDRTITWSIRKVA
jgi:hypothetical protein